LTTSVGSLRILQQHPEIVSWFKAIGEAAGENVSMDLMLCKRNQEPDRATGRIEASTSISPEWINAIEAAAGPDAWVDTTIRRRNGQPDSVVVQCALKCLPPAGNGQKEKP